MPPSMSFLIDSIEPDRSISRSDECRMGVCHDSPLRLGELAGLARPRCCSMQPPPLSASHRLSSPALDSSSQHQVGVRLREECSPASILWPAAFKQRPFPEIQGEHLHSLGARGESDSSGNLYGLAALLSNND